MRRRTNDGNAAATPAAAVGRNGTPAASRAQELRRRALALAALGGALLPAAVANAQDEIAGVGDAFDAAELIPSANAALPPILPGQDPGARTRPPEKPVPPTDATDAVVREWFGGDEWTAWTRATGDWGGARTALEEAGVSFNGSFVGDWGRVFSGGVREGSDFRFLLDLNLSFDLGVIAGLEGGSVFADFQTANETVASGDSGAFQAISNIAIGGSITQLSQLWYEQWLGDELVRIKLGKIDANTEFAFIGAAGGFINASAGFSPAIFALPTYPNPSTALVAFVYPDESLYLGAGLFDGATAVDGVATGSRGPATMFSDDLSDDLFWIAEAGVTLREAGPLSATRVAVGGWWHTGEFARFDGGSDDGTGGVYLVGETRLWAPGACDLADDEDARGLWAFVQYGWADDAVSAVAQQLGGGLALNAPFTGRDDDSLGVYASWVDFSDDPSAGIAGDETMVELYYDFAVTPSFHVKPDLQWVLDPSGDPSVEDALVGTVRCIWTF